MKPIKKKVIVEVEYCACTVPEHRHKKFEHAENCIIKNNKPRRNCNHWNMDNMRAISGMRDAGKTYKECGEAFNISSTQASAVIAKYKRKLRRMTYDA